MPKWEWQKIETAPKDGTRVLLFRDGDIVVGMFRHPFADTQEQGEWLSVALGLPGKGGTVERLEARFPHDVVHDGSPTHWMPLPSPPE